MFGKNTILRGRACKYAWGPGPGALSIKSVLRGKAAWTTRAGRYELEPEQLLVLNDGEEYSIEADALQPVETFCIFFARGFVEDVRRALVTSRKRSCAAKRMSTRASRGFHRSAQRRSASSRAAARHAAQRGGDRARSASRPRVFARTKKTRFRPRCSIAGMHERMVELLDAIRKGDAARVAEILDADPSLLDGPGLLQSLYRGRNDLVQLFLDRGHRPTYFEAAALGDLPRLRELLDADPSLLDAFGDDGFNALGLSIFFRHPEVARLLIDRGADVVAPARNAMKVAPVHAAATQGDREIMQLLLERGADPNARQESDYTPLHSSANRGDAETAQLLVSKGADARAKAKDGKTPADVARERGFNELAAWLDNA